MDYSKYKVEYPTVRTKETLAAYREQERETVKAFKFDLEYEFNIPHDAAYAGKLFNKAWDMGHSGGLNEVHTYYDELAELVHAVVSSK